MTEVPDRYGEVQWGVRFSDGSVIARWTGRTARQRATEYAAGAPVRSVTVVWRRWTATPRDAASWHEGEPAPDLSDLTAVEEWLDA